MAILCAQRRFLTDRHLEAVGIDPNSNLIIGGAQDEPGVTEFDKLWDPENVQTLLSQTLRPQNVRWSRQPKHS